MDKVKNFCDHSPIRERNKDNSPFTRSPNHSRQLDNDNSSSSTDCNSVTYENYSPDKSIKFPTTYNKDEYSTALQQCFIEERYFPINTPHYLLEGPDDEDSMKSKISSATKVYLIIMCNHKNLEMPTMFRDDLHNKSQKTSSSKGQS